MPEARTTAGPQTALAAAAGPTHAELLERFVGLISATLAHALAHPEAYTNPGGAVVLDAAEGSWHWIRSTRLAGLNRNETR